MGHAQGTSGPTHHWSLEEQPRNEETIATGSCCVQRKHGAMIKLREITGLIGQYVVSNIKKTKRANIVNVTAPIKLTIVVKKKGPKTYRTILWFNMSLITCEMTESLAKQMTAHPYWRLLIFFVPGLYSRYSGPLMPLHKFWMAKKRVFCQEFQT